MKKRFTLLSTALLLGASFSAVAAVDKAEWKEGNYYQLQSGEYYLVVDGAVSDSVIVKKKVEEATKASLDSTLWQITKRTTSGGVVYQFRNKATNAYLAFAPKENATT